MKQVHLTTLEGISVQDAHGRPLASVLSQSKRLGLLIYLAAANGRARRRDVVVSLFWPELDDEHARGALRQALSYLRRALGDGVILSRGEDLWIDVTHIEVDALKFEQACADGRLEDAMKYYKGNFLEGFFVADAAPELDQWVEDERARLRRSAHKACSEIARTKIALGLRADAVSWARRATELAPNDEAELRSLIMLLADLGDRASAVEAYDVFAPVGSGFRNRAFSGNAGSLSKKFAHNLRHCLRESTRMSAYLRFLSSSPSHSCKAPGPRCSVVHPEPRCMLRPLGCSHSPGTSLRFLPAACADRRAISESPCCQSQIWMAILLNPTSPTA